MSKINLLKKMVCIGLVPTMAAIPTYLASCSGSDGKIVIDSIELVSQESTVRSGTQLQINAKIMPSGEIYNNLNWSLVPEESEDAIDWAFVNRQGIIVVSENSPKQDKIDFYVKAVSPFDSSVFAQKLITYQPPTVPDYFRGFDSCENEGTDPDYSVSYLSRGGEKMKMPLVSDDGFNYTTKEPIDAYMSVSYPKEWNDSVFFFKPVFDETEKQVSKMGQICHTTSNTAIMLMGYYDGDSIPFPEGIPPSLVIYSSLITETLLITFDELPGVTVTLNFRVYQKSPDQDSNCVISYDKQPGDPHTVIYHDQGDYETSIFCPSQKSRATYRESMSTIYVYRNYYEKLAIDFNWDELNNVDPRIKGALTLKHNEVYFERPYDGFAYYKVTIYYTFVLDEILWDEIENFDKMLLFTLYTEDPLIEQGINCKLAFYLEWV